MRDTTERPEGVDAGTLKLVGEETIYKTFKLILENKEEYEKMSASRVVIYEEHCFRRK